MRRFLPCLLLLVLVRTAACQSTVESEFEAANRAFDDKKFLEARQHYDALISQGISTANLFYNLGSTNHQIGANGLAMLNYERAVALNPRHRDAYAALDLLRKNSTAKLPAADVAGSRVRHFDLRSMDHPSERSRLARHLCSPCSCCATPSRRIRRTWADYHLRRGRSSLRRLPRGIAQAI
jgi:tetratricopeptide (TPR) repeat protein